MTGISLRNKMSQHYSDESLHHLQVISREDNILTVFDLGIVSISSPCTCSVGHDHYKLEYKLYPLEIFLKLQLSVAGWPLIGKIKKVYSWAEIKSKLVDYYEEFY